MRSYTIVYTWELQKLGTTAQDTLNSSSADDVQTASIIVIGIIVLALLIAIIIYCLCKFKSRRDCRQKYSKVNNTDVEVPMRDDKDVQSNSSQLNDAGNSTTPKYSQACSDALSSQADNNLIPERVAKENEEARASSNINISVEINETKRGSPDEINRDTPNKAKRDSRDETNRKTLRNNSGNLPRKTERNSKYEINTNPKNAASIQSLKNNNKNSSDETNKDIGLQCQTNMNLLDKTERDSPNKTNTESLYETNRQLPDGINRNSQYVIKGDLSERNLGSCHKINRNSSAQIQNNLQNDFNGYTPEDISRKSSDEISNDFTTDINRSLPEEKQKDIPSETNGNLFHEANKVLPEEISKDSPDGCNSCKPEHINENFSDGTNKKMMDENDIGFFDKGTEDLPDEINIELSNKTDGGSISETKQLLPHETKSESLNEIGKDLPSGINRCSLYKTSRDSPHKTIKDFPNNTCIKTLCEVANDLSEEVRKNSSVETKKDLLDETNKTILDETNKTANLQNKTIRDSPNETSKELRDKINIDSPNEKRKDLLDQNNSASPDKTNKSLPNKANIASLDESSIRPISPHKSIVRQESEKHDRKINAQHGSTAFEDVESRSSETKLEGIDFTPSSNKAEPMLSMSNNCFEEIKAAIPHDFSHCIQSKDDAEKKQRKNSVTDDTDPCVETKPENCNISQIELMAVYNKRFASHDYLKDSIDLDAGSWMKDLREIFDPDSINQILLGLNNNEKLLNLIMVLQEKNDIKLYKKFICVWKKYNSVKAEFFELVLEKDMNNKGLLQIDKIHEICSPQDDKEFELSLRDLTGDDECLGQNAVDAEDNLTDRKIQVSERMSHTSQNLQVVDS